MEFIDKYCWGKKVISLAMAATNYPISSNPVTFASFNYSLNKK